MNVVGEQAESVNVDFYTKDNEVIEKDGEVYIKGVASTSDPDMNRDIVTQPALENMLERIRNGKVNLHYDHRHDLMSVIGSIVQAEIIGNQLHITAKILPGACEMVKGFLDNGIHLGLSVGGKAIRSPVNRHIIHDYDIIEISLTPNPALQQSKGTVHQVPFPTCISGACYLAMKEADKAEVQAQQNVVPLKHSNYDNNDNKSYNFNEDINMNSYQQQVELPSTQELEQANRYLAETLEKIEYNNQYGFDNKSYSDEAAQILNELQIDENIASMCAEIDPEDIKDISYLMNNITNDQYHELVREAGIESMMPKDLDVKFIDEGLKTTQFVNGIIGALANATNLGRSVFGSKKDPVSLPYTPYSAYNPYNPYAGSYPYNPYVSRPKKAVQSELEDRIRKDSKSINMVGEPMRPELDQQAQLPPELMEQIQQVVMSMINEAFVQKGSPMMEQIENSIMQKMGLAGGSPAVAGQMAQQQGGQGQEMSPEEQAQMMAMQEGQVPPEEIPPEYGGELTPEEEAAVEEEEFEEQAQRKKAKKEKEEDNKSYNFPDDINTASPFLSDRNNVGKSKIASMQPVIDQQDNKSIQGTGFTKSRDEYGRLIR